MTSYMIMMIHKQQLNKIANGKMCVPHCHPKEALVLVLNIT